MAALTRFSTWFNRRFGWFFTNGMKECQWIAIAIATSCA